MLKRLLIILPVLILFIGIVGNVFNALIFAKKGMRSSPTLRLLLYLSIADLIVLIMVTSEILLKSDFSLGLRDSSLFVCNIQKFISYSFNFASSCLSVTVNIYRAKIISYVTQRNRTINWKKRVRFKRTQNKTLSFIDNLAKFIFIFVFILNSHFILLLRPTYSVSFSENDDFKPNNVTKIFKIPSKFRKRPRGLLFEQKIQTLSVKKVRHRINSIDNEIYNWMPSVMVTDSGRRTMFRKLTSTSFLTPQNITATKEFDYYIEDFKCVPRRNSFYEYFLSNVWIWIDISIFSIIPFVSMCLCSVIIIVNLIKLNKSYSARLVSNTNTFTKRIYTRKFRNNMQISFMLISSNLYFLLSMCIFWIWFTAYENNRQETFGTSLKQSLVYTLLYSNNAFGILFYCLFSTKYRKEVFRLGLCKFLCKRFRKRRKFLTLPTIT